MMVMKQTNKGLLQEADSGEKGSDVTGPAITIENLRKVYDGDDDQVTAVDGIDLEIEAGTAVGLLGPNGAGKTTTIKLLLGLILPTNGHVNVCGIDLHQDSRRPYRRIGAMLEGARNIYWRLTVRENMRFFAALAGNSPVEMRSRHEELLEQFNLDHKADTAVRELSRGEKQKVSLMCTLARDVDVVFLDEPTLGLDIESSLELRRKFRRLITDNGTTVLLSSHDMDVIEDVCDRVVIMNDGQIIADDSVENLLDVFDTQTYEIIVEESLEADLGERLREQINITDISRRGSRTQLIAQVTGDEFYDLIETLQTAKLSLHSVNVVEPELEEIFLQMTDDRSQERQSITGCPEKVQNR